MTAPVRWCSPELVISVRYSEWSPDGTLIAFSHPANGGRFIYTMTPSGGQLTQLSPPPGNDGAPAWSPDGTHIAFGTGRGVGLSI